MSLISLQHFTVILSAWVFIFACLFDLAECQSDYSSWSNTFRILRIVLPIIILIAACGGGGYCCKKRRERNSAQQRALAPYGPNATQGPYVVPIGDQTSSTTTGYAPNFEGQTFSGPIDYNKAEPIPAFAQPPPSYEEVIASKDSQHNGVRPS